ncbi:MAG: slipin family protein [Pseudomonadota bacterium]
MFRRHVTIEDHQRALLIRDGRVRDVLGPGRHRIGREPRTRVEIQDVRHPVYSGVRFEAIERDRPDLVAKHFLVVEPGEVSVGIIRAGTRVIDVVPPRERRAYWQALAEHSAEIVDIADAPMLAGKDIAAFEWVAPGLVSVQSVPVGHKALMHVDGALRTVLGPGRHGAWTGVQAVAFTVVDMRGQGLEVTAQEILTEDRVSVRVTLSAFWRVSDPEKAGQAKDLKDALYRYIQFAIRDAVARRTLGGLLDARGSLDGELTHAVASLDALDDLGIEVQSVGLKDVILPGDMREILNRVVEAEKQAQANLIRRHEETAATRSLLNTARLMENNPLLLRLKELETLEKLTEKIGRLDVTTSATGQGLDGLVNNLVTLARRGADTASGPGEGD